VLWGVDGTPMACEGSEAMAGTRLHDGETVADTGVGRCNNLWADFLPSN